MATTWADIIASAMVIIDDVRLDEQIAVSPAQFYRRMAGFVNMAFPLLSRPPQLFSYLKGGLVEPQYDDFEWSSTDESVTDPQTDVDTQKLGYDLCSVSVRVHNANGTISLLPYMDATYDSETGIVTFPQQAEAGIEYELDFYTDGEFPDLSEHQMRLFALAIAIVWDERFARNWLNITSKIHDENFQTVNESQYMEKANKRLNENRIVLNDELRAYEQMCVYNAVVKNGDNSVKLV